MTSSSINATSPKFVGIPQGLTRADPTTAWTSPRSWSREGLSERSQRCLFSGTTLHCPRGLLSLYSACYNPTVPDVDFADSAFRHGYAEEDCFEVLTGRYLKVRSQRGLENVYELLGRNLAGEYLHIVYRVLADARLRVFHIARMNEKQRRRYRRIQT